MAAPMSSCRKYLIHFAHEHLEFRVPEFLSIAKVFGVDLSLPADYDVNSPYLVVDVPSVKCVKQIASRAILVKSIYELWGEGKTYDLLFEALKKLPTSFVSPHLTKGSSFRIKHDSFNKQLTQPEKIKLIERVIGESGMSFDGEVNLKSPAESFHLLEYYGRQDVTTAPDQPELIYFGRWVTDGHRHSIKQFDLKRRKVIGNTSMDAGLSMIMANMGLVSDASVVFDPFVGTGSLLVASAHFGGVVFGTDIDWKVLHGRGLSSRADQKWRDRDETVLGNLAQYGLAGRYGDVLVGDTARGGKMWRGGVELYDAIITDPPYGIREPTKKVGSSKEDPVVPDEMKDGHVPSKVTYDLTQILIDLVNFSARSLSVGGRLVYWIPVYREDYSAENIPSHPCLRLVANSEQPLNAKVARRLVTMEKTHRHSPELDITSLTNDHYKDASFREKYFRPPEKGPANRKHKKWSSPEEGEKQQEPEVKSTAPSEDHSQSHNSTNANS